MLCLRGSGVCYHARERPGVLGGECGGAGPVSRGGVAPPVASGDQGDRRDQGGQEPAHHCPGSVDCAEAPNDRPWVV